MNKRILVVDDDLDFAETLSESFSMRGCNVDIAASGEEALKMYEDGIYDVAFMDVRLPGMNGVESFQHIRKNNPNACVVMMTGYSEENDLIYAKAEGAEAVFNKSSDIDKILKYIEDADAQIAVLLVDDDIDFSETTQEILEDAGFHVALAHDTQNALEKIENRKIDILLLDIRLNHTSGLHLYQYLHHLSADIPTIVVTGYAAEEVYAVNTLKALNVQEVLTKPIHPEDLLTVIRRYSEAQQK